MMRSASRTIRSVANERRKVVRRRTLYASKVAYADGSHVFDCTVWDFSYAGARVRLSEAQALPGSVHLLDFGNRLAYEARVAWSKSPEYGLEFLKLYRFADIPTAGLQQLIADELRV